MSMGRIPCSATAVRWAGFSRRCRIPPCTLGCKVLTRPSSISGNPVSSEISFTAMPESRSSLAVPPVEISSTPSLESLRANSTSPVLSVTLRMARWIFRGVDDIESFDRGGWCNRKFISRMGVRKTVPGRGLPGLRGFSDGWSAVLQELDFGFCLQPNLAVLHLDRVFDGLTPVLFADLVGFL